MQGKRRRKGAGDLNEEEKSLSERAPRKRPPAKKFDWEDEQKEGDTMDSLEKYRPHNYDFGSRRGGESGRQSHKLQSSASVDHSDINDLRDYYSGIGTHQRALRRLNLLQGGHSGDQQDPMGDYEPRGGGNYGQRKVSFGGYPPQRYGDDVDEDEEVRPTRRKSTTAAYGGGGQDRDRFAHSKNFWLDEVDNARKRSGMPTKNEQMRMEEEEEKGPQRRYDWENDTFIEDKPKQSEALSTTGRARNILDQVKESTMALQNLNEQAEDDAYDRMGYGQQRPRQRQQRRQQQRQQEPEMGGYGGGGGGYGRSMSMDEYYEDPPYRQQQRQERPHYATLADEVLADRGGGAYRRKPIQAEESRHPHQNQNEDNYGGGYSSYTRRQPSPPSTTGWRDTEDVDAMIADLKKKTTGRDMRDVLRNIEASDRRGGGGGGDYYQPPPSEGWGRGGSSRPDSDYSFGANRQGGGGGYGGQNENYYGGGGGDERGGRGASFASRQSPPPSNLKTRFSARGPFDEDENEVGGGGGRFRRQRTSEGDLERRGGGGGGTFSSARGGSRFSRDELDAGGDDFNDMMPKKRFGRRNVPKFDNDDEEASAPFGRTNRGGGRRRFGGDDEEDFTPPMSSSKGRSSVGRDFGGGGVGRRAKQQQRNRSVLDDDDDD